MSALSTRHSPQDIHCRSERGNNGNAVRCCVIRLEVCIPEPVTGLTEPQGLLVSPGSITLSCQYPHMHSCKHAASAATTATAATPCQAAQHQARPPDARSHAQTADIAACCPPGPHPCTPHPHLPLPPALHPCYYHYDGPRSCPLPPSPAPATCPCTFPCSASTSVAPGMRTPPRLCAEGLIPAPAAPTPALPPCTLG